MDSLMRLIVMICLVGGASANAATELWERHNVMSSPGSNSERVVGSWQGGKWAYQDMSGYIKVLFTENVDSATSESVAQRVYLQWVRTDQVDNELVYSIAVKEISSAPSFVFDEPKCQPAATSCNSFLLAGNHHYEGYPAQFPIEIGGLGQYFIKFQL